VEFVSFKESQENSLAALKTAKAPDAKAVVLELDEAYTSDGLTPGSEPDQKSDFAITPGTSTGPRVTYDLRYEGLKNVQVIIVNVLPAVVHELRAAPSDS
jgi:hypothetical protein